ncbi:ROK family protein [bacterium]|nr:ROK family protein [bacterium]
MSPDNRELRAINRSSVLNLIFTLSPISRVRISRLTGLCKPTVSSIVSELIDEGLVRESNQVQTAMGRKPVNLRINENYKVYGLIDVKLWSTELAVCDLTGRVLDSRSIPTVPGQPVAFLSECSRTLAGRLDSYSQRVLGVSLILPCALDSRRGMVHQHRALDWHEVDVREVVSAELDCPVLIENDGRAAALAELMFAPETRELGSFVYVLVTDGIGIGVVIGRQLYYGAHFLDDRIGAKTVDINGRREEFTKDIWEQNGSLRGIVQRYRDLTGNPLAYDINPDLDHILTMARQGDPTALWSLKQAARYLAVGLASIYRGIDPERIIVGGEITPVWDLVVDEILREMESQDCFHQTSLRGLIVPGSLRRGTFEGGRALILKDLIYASCSPNRRGPAQGISGKRIVPV